MKSRIRVGRSHGFSLIEIIIVITIIGLIVAWAGNRIFGQADKAKWTATKAQISQLAATLDQYKLDTGKYPNTQDGLKALLQAPSGVANWNGPYVNKPEQIKDGWNNDYIYRSPGTENRPFEIVSLGSDGQEGGEGVPNRDIKSWE
jgi:general secretion pathway protein G